jgi:hypothetical protein
MDTVAVTVTIYSYLVSDIKIVKEPSQNLSPSAARTLAVTVTVTVVATVAVMVTVTVMVTIYSYLMNCERTSS